jgi:hypothetical protein
MNYLKLHAVSIFALGVGLFMLQVPDLNIWLHLGIGILTVIGAVLTIVQYAPVMGWKLFMTRPDLFGPEGESHERALKLYDWSVQVTRPYVSKFDLGTALVADVILMSGLLAQGWHVLFGMQFVACIIGYAVIQSFLTNYHAIYAFVNGSETA